MFEWCENFDSDLSKWNVSNVTDTTNMFNGCKNFKGKGLDKWDASNITEMNGMFNGCQLLKNKPNWYKY